MTEPRPDPAQRRAARAAARAQRVEQRQQRGRRDAAGAEGAHRRRAPAMSVEQRREAIIAATIPLLLERGDALTTSQIARAAGIAEGTVFRAFRDKQDLLVSCLKVAARSDA